MKVRDIMVETPKYCRLDANLIVAAETMSVSNCSLLPVVDQEGKVVGVITDRDICIALGTRNQRASDVLIRDVMTSRVYACAVEDDIHAALETMEKHQVRRLPVVNLDGKLAGVLSIGDITLHAEKKMGKNIPDLSSDEVVETYQGIRVRQLTEQTAQL